MADHPVLHLSILTPERPVLEEVVERVIVPLHDGELGVYPKHAPLLGKMGHGELRAHRLDQVFRYYVGGGFVEVAGDAVTVLSDEAAPVGELDAEEARLEVQAAQQRPARGDDQIDRRLHDLSVAQARLRVARRAATT